MSDCHCFTVADRSITFEFGDEWVGEKAARLIAGWHFAARADDEASPFIIRLSRAQAPTIPSALAAFAVNQGHCHSDGDSLYLTTSDSLMRAHPSGVRLVEAWIGEEACAATIGTVALPELDKRGYDKPMALGSLAAGGTLGILIPPSVALLVYGSLTNNSICKLFVGGVIPGILLTLCFSIYIFLEALRRPSVGREQRANWKERLAALPVMLPPLIVFSIVMGSIYFGIATPTEAAALGIAVALGFAWKAGRLSFDMLNPCFIRTAQLTGMILPIITGAFVLNLALSMLWEWPRP